MYILTASSSGEPTRSSGHLVEDTTYLEGLTHYLAVGDVLLVGQTPDGRHIKWDQLYWYLLM